MTKVRYLKVLKFLIKNKHENMRRITQAGRYKRYNTSIKIQKKHNDTKTRTQT